MKYTVYKKVEMDENGTKEPVNYVGVHPFRWHDHPEHPDFGFTEIELDLPDDEEISKWANSEEKIENYMPETLKLHIRKKIECRIEGVNWLRDKIKNQLK